MKDLEKIYAHIDEHLNNAHMQLAEAIKLADEHGLSFYFQPQGMGYYKASMSVEQAQKYVETGDYEKLNEEDKETVKMVLEDFCDYNNDENYESWQTSFC